MLGWLLRFIQTCDANLGIAGDSERLIRSRLITPNRFYHEFAVWGEHSFVTASEMAYPGGVTYRCESQMRTSSSAQLYASFHLRDNAL